MSSDDASPVLRCGLCNKPFDKDATLKRHGYYCRSRNAPLASRTRSCSACVKAKARCDSKRPSCSRCLIKGSDCQYPGKPRKQSSEPNDTAQTARLSSPAASPEFGSSTAVGDLTFNTPVDADPWNFDWNDTPPDLTALLDMDDFGASDVLTKGTFQFAPPQSLVSKWSSPPTLDYAALAEPLFTYNTRLTPQPSLETRSLVTRHRSNPGASGITKLILATLKSYPLMLLRHDSLPPFVHPHWLSATSTSSSDMSPLTNCVSLTHMLSSGVSGSRRLFWRDVRLECESLCATFRSLPQLALAAAMQALSIYLLVRVGEGETEHNNVDALLLATVGLLAREFNTRERYCQIARGDGDGDGEGDGEADGPEVRWERWIFRESKRRLCIVYQVVNLLVYFEPAALCELQADLALAPLPASKRMWEASDAASWAAEERLDAHVDYALAADGELVEIDLHGIHTGAGGGQSASKPRKVAKWEEWCAGMDGLGGLVMLAGSLIA